MVTLTGIDGEKMDTKEHQVRIAGGTAFLCFWLYLICYAGCNIAIECQDISEQLERIAVAVETNDGR